jgi:hypothetical protein
MTRTASCNCGQLTLACEGDPVRISMCHCLACQKRTGSAFGIQARFPASAVRIAGAHSAWSRVGDSGSRITFHFCATCGATVFYEMDAYPEIVAVPIGAFADPTFPPPRVSVYGARRHPWTTMPDLQVEDLD